MPLISAAAGLIPPDRLRLTVPAMLMSQELPFPRIFHKQRRLEQMSPTLTGSYLQMYLLPSWILRDQAGSSPSCSAAWINSLPELRWIPPTMSTWLEPPLPGPVSPRHLTPSNAPLRPTVLPARILRALRVLLPSSMPQATAWFIPLSWEEAALALP